MADYWKSQPRHFCDFCKCWIADNKPSRDFHEKGKKHQVNVEKKIADVRKKGIKKAEKEEEENSTLKQIEKAALKALQEDLKRDPSLASQYGVELKDSALAKINAASKAVKPPQKPRLPRLPAPSSIQGESAPPALPVEETPDESQSEVDDTPSSSSVQVWQELKSPEGYTYYWNTVTNEVTWVKPEDYVPPMEGHESDNEDVPEQQPTTGDQEVTSSSEDSDTVPEPSDVAAISMPENIADIPLPCADIPLPSTDKEVTQENDKEVEEEKTESSDDDTPSEPAPPRPERPARKPAPYGSWETVQKKEEDHVDLQLPEVKEQPVAKVISLSAPKIKFREKKVDTLGAELVAFKKRKLNTGLKLRKKEEDDS